PALLLLAAPVVGTRRGRTVRAREALRRGVFELQPQLPPAWPEARGSLVRPVSEMPFRVPRARAVPAETAPACDLRSQPARRREPDRGLRRAARVPRPQAV